MKMEKLRFVKKNGKKIASALVTVLLVCTVFLCLTVVIQVLDRGYASLGGYSFFRVVTGSMEPELPAGSLIVSKSVDIDTLEVGDIVCFRSKSSEMLGRSITHRVISISKGTNGATRLLTKGDANVAADEYYVTEDNLIGRVVWWSGETNFLSDLLTFLSGKIGFLACVALPCLIMAGFIFRNSVKNIRRDIAGAMKELGEIERREAEIKQAATTEVKEKQPASSRAASPQKSASEPNQGTGLPAPMHAKSNDSQKQQTAEDVLADLTGREYQEMYARIRAELLEELKQEYDREQSKK